MKKLNKKGFTLIELLVVVAIIAILAGIVLVSLNSARERSEKASLQSTLASVMPVASMCINDGGTLTADPTAGDLICSGVDDVDETWPALPSNISTYSYDVDSGDIIGIDPDGVTIFRCTVSTGSCISVNETPAS